jgi:Zn-dependent protease
MFGTPSLGEIVLRAITFLIAMSVHEFAHGYGAYLMGDTTARDMGRLTLNPFKNIDWFGFISAIVIGFGFLGWAPINEARMRNRRWGMVFAVLAGPVSNLILAVLCAIPFWFGLQPGFVGEKDFIPTFGAFMLRMVTMNIGMFLFNLLPLAPLDGWTIMLKLVPPEVAYKLARYQRESTYLFYALIFMSFVGIPILGFIINPPYEFLLNLLLPFI